MLARAINDWGTLPRAAVDPPSLDVSKSGLGARLEENQVAGLGLGCAWLNVSEQEVRRRGLMVPPASPSGRPGFTLWRLGSGNHHLAGKGL